LTDLDERFECSIISLNWDIVVERRMRSFMYPVPIWKHPLGENPNWAKNSIHLIKLHGSANWFYCDNCRRLFFSEDGKGALLHNAYLETIDFSLFKPILGNIVDLGRTELEKDHSTERRCGYCGGKLGGRLATFSYRKFFAIPQFQALWDQASLALQDARLWLFVGYSMPEADYEFRHLLKSAQLAGKEWPPKINVIIKENLGGPITERYLRFFGLSDENIFNEGLEKWVTEQLEGYLKTRESPG
ncbi:MAG: hypothetical protein AB1405_09575, partial [Bdellovibrionota bacterium]